MPVAKAAPDGAGDVWTWTAMDRDGKLMISCALGDRSAETAREFMFDLAGRLAGRVQLATDGCGASLKAVTDAFSKTVEAHAYAVALNFMHHNLCRTRRTLGTPPAMAAGLATRPGEVEDVAALAEAAEAAPKTPKPHKPRQLKA